MQGKRETKSGRVGKRVHGQRGMRGVIVRDNGDTVTVVRYDTGKPETVHISRVVVL